MTKSSKFKMLPKIAPNGLCYYIGSACDLINPLINTECRQLVCVDIIGDSFLPALTLALSLPEKLKRNIHVYSVINRFVEQWTQLSENNSQFGRISHIRVKGNRFEIKVAYKNHSRFVVFYSGADGNDIPGPREIWKGKIGVLYISMGLVAAVTIRRLNPLQIVVYNTVLNDCLKRRKCRAVVGQRINPWTDKIQVWENEEYLIFG